MMQDLKRYFQYLDGVAEETEPAYVTTRRGPMFYNIPTANQADRHVRAGPRCGLQSGSGLARDARSDQDRR